MKSDKNQRKLEGWEFDHTWEGESWEPPVEIPPTKNDEHWANFLTGCKLAAGGAALLVVAHGIGWPLTLLFVLFLILFERSL